MWWSSEIRSLLWVVLCPVGPTYMGYQNSVDHHTHGQGFIVCLRGPGFVPGLFQLAVDVEFDRFFRQCPVVCPDDVVPLIRLEHGAGGVVGAGKSADPQVEFSRRVVPKIPTLFQRPFRKELHLALPVPEA